MPLQSTEVVSVVRTTAGAIAMSRLLAAMSNGGLVPRYVDWNSLSVRSEKMVTPNTAVRLAARSALLSLSMFISDSSNTANLSLASAVDEYCRNVEHYVVR
jgi:hypothetical protein